VKKYQIKLAVIALAIMICVGIIVVFLNRQKNKANEWQVAQSMEQFLFMEPGKQTEGSLCIVVSQEENPFFFQVFFGKYIAFKKIKGKKYFDDAQEAYCKEYEETIFELYNFKTGEMEKTLDLLAIEEEYTPGKQHRYTMLDARKVDGKEYLIWRVDGLKGQENESEYIFYDINEDKVVKDVALDKSYNESEKKYYKSVYILFDDECNFLEVNGYTPQDAGSYEAGGIYISYSNSIREGIVEVGMLAEELPKENAKLYEEFPGLKEYEGEPGEQAGLWIAGHPDAEEVLRMVMEEGTEITYEGCVLEPRASIDGKEHEISCMDDYIKWRNWKQVSPELVK